MAKEKNNTEGKLENVKPWAMKLIAIKLGEYFDGSKSQTKTQRFFTTKNKDILKFSKTSISRRFATRDQSLKVFKDQTPTQYLDIVGPCFSKFNKKIRDIHKIKPKGTSRMTEEQLPKIHTYTTTVLHSGVYQDLETITQKEYFNTKNNFELSDLKKELSAKHSKSQIKVENYSYGKRNNPVLMHRRMVIKQLGEYSQRKLLADNHRVKNINDKLDNFNQQMAHKHGLDDVDEDEKLGLHNYTMTRVVKKITKKRN